MKVVIILSVLCALATGQRITTIQLDGVQYFISRMNPYSPELNYFLAYQYCRSLGLQLASFETKEKVESMSQYLQNAGYSKYDFWTSGNRLGTGMFLWMSTGLPFNATFDYFNNANDAVKAGLLDPIDHNSNTSPQRTARDSSSGLEKGCVMLQAPSLRWAPEDCSAVKDFICEQTRCYYYNYGSIPVSSAQGRPLTSTTPTYSSDQIGRQTTTYSMPTISYATTPLPMLHAGKSLSELKLSPPNSIATLRVTTDTSGSGLESNSDYKQIGKSEEQSAQTIIDNNKSIDENAYNHVEPITGIIAQDATKSDDFEEKIETTTSVEQHLRKISEEVEKLSLRSNTENLERQSFLSLDDLMKSLRKSDWRNQPQIDSDYSNTMVGGDRARNIKTDDLRYTNRALY